MKKKYLQLFMLTNIILFVISACDNQKSRDTSGKTQIISYREKMEEKKVKSKNLKQKKSSLSSKEKYPPKKGKKSTPIKENTRKDTAHKKTQDKNTAPSFDKRKNIPSNWIDRRIQKEPTPSQLIIWKNIIIAIDRHIFARKVIYAPLGSQSVEFKHISNKKYKVSGHCIIIEQTGRKKPYIFECTASANQYEAKILEMQFKEPNL